MKLNQLRGFKTHSKIFIFNCFILKKASKVFISLKVKFCCFFLISRRYTKSESVNKLYFNPFSSIKFKTGIFIL